MGHDHPHARLSDTPIAIVGLGGLYPRSGDLREFWSNIAESTDCISDVPETHWKVSDYYDPDPAVPDKTYCRRGGFIPPVAFNPLEFGMPPAILEVTDILQILSLVVARDTLADTGVQDAPWYDPARTGVILGITGANSLTQPLATRLQTPMLKRVVRSAGLGDAVADEIADAFAEAFAPWEENSFPGMLGNVVAGRIANRFDFGGTNCTIDAACASSMAAVHMAASELVSGRADLMLSGGCDAENTIFMYMCFSKTPALSRSERIRPFDQDADGTLIGEGIGMLAMKRLADAERDGDRIYSVLRGIGTSSDGRFKSIYAPRASGQVLALQRAYDDAAAPPASIGLLECHGTGTAVGDETELSALREVYDAADVARGSVAVGSVKSQIGHTKAAAGAASLIKLSLALHQKMLPATINVDRPAKSLHDSPFHLSGHARPWVLEPGRPTRRAAASSFGFGGTNFHCVLEEADPVGLDLRMLHPVSRVHLWHATDPAALLALLDSGDAGLDEAEVPPEHARLALVARDDAELDRLREKAAGHLRENPDVGSFELPGGAQYGRQAAVPGKVALLFAGQGSQYVGMGTAAALGVPIVRFAFDRASLATPVDPPLARVLFPAPAADADAAAEQEAQLRRTDRAQPAIAALSIGHFLYLKSLGLVPDGALGHSFGELTALFCGGSISDEEYLTLAVARGRAMADLPEGSDLGTMAAVHAGREEVQQLLTGHSDVSVCNINSPGQVVVGGGTDAVTAFVAACTAGGVRASALPVAAAFHTSYVSHAVDAFRTAVEAVSPQQPSPAVYANTEGAQYGPDVALNREVLVNQLLNPVAFSPQLEQMYADGFRVFVELGPKQVLSGLARQTLAGHDDVVVLAADGGPGQDGDRTLKQAAARLAVLGLPLHGFNRFTQPPAPPASTEGMRIVMSGVNHVSDKRRAHRDALEDGRFEEGVQQPDPGSNGSGPASNGSAPASNGSVPASNGSVPAAAVSAPRSAPAPTPPPPPAAVPHPVATHPVAAVPVGVSAAVAGHLSMHEEYLGSQLRVAEQLSHLLQQHADTGTPDDGVLPGIDAVTEHSLAIGRSHIHAGDVLRSLVELDGPHRDGGPTWSPTPAEQRIARPVPGPSSPPMIEAAPTAAPAAIRPTVDTTHVQARITVDPPVAPVAAPVAPVVAAPVAPVAAPVEPAPVAAPAVGAEAVRTALLDIVADKTGYPTDMLDPTMDVEADLGIDSIKRVEIMGSLRERFPEHHPADPERLAELRTLDDIIAFVVEDAAGQDGAGDEPAGADATEGTAGPDPKAREEAPGIGRMQARLHPIPHPDHLDGAFTTRRGVLVGAGAVADRLGDLLTADGWTVHRSLDEVPGNEPIDLVAYLADPVPADGVEALTAALLLARDTQRRLQDAAVHGRAAFLTVTALDGLLGLGGVPRDAALLGGLPGLVKTLAVEAPTLFCRAVDIAPHRDAAIGADLLHAELHDAQPDLPEVAHGADGVRRTLGLADERTAADLLPAGPPVEGPGPADLFVVTGGGRGVTAACVVELARRTRVGLLLLGRTGLVDEPGWAGGVPAEGLRAAAAAELTRGGTKPVPREVERMARDVVAQREIRGTLDGAREAGAEVDYLAVDITDRDATATALAPLRGRITGIVHGAGVLIDKLVVDKQAPDVATVLAPKLAGLASVLDAVEQPALRHVVLFSSVAGFFGNRAQSDYAMANEALNRIACSLKRDHPAAQVTSVNWGAWEGGMVTPELARMFADRGIPLVPRSVGVRLFAEQFTPARTGDVVCVAGPTTPLSVGETAPPPDRVVLRRDLRPLVGDAVLADHTLAGVAVLPATAAVGAVLDAVQRSRPGSDARQVTGFAVFSGLRFDDCTPTHLEITLTADGTSTAVDVRDPGGRPRYRGAVQPVPPAADRLSGLPPIDGGTPAGAYESGALFHGPALRGITHVLAEDDRRLVLACRLADTTLGDGGYGTDRYSPVLADLLLQAALVRVHRRSGRNCLPTAVGQVELHHALPDDEPFLVVVDDDPAPDGAGADSVRCTVTACDPDGRVLLRLRAVDLVASAALTDSFAPQAT